MKAPFDGLSDQALFMVLCGILKMGARFDYHPKRGYRVWLSNRNPEPLYLLEAALGGKVHHRGKFSTWMLTGKAKVLKLWEHYEPYKNENQSLF